MSRPAYPPLCSLCKHLAYGTGTCNAFPDGIPEEVLVGEPHFEPIGNEPYTFEEDDDVTEVDVEQWRQERLEWLKLGVLVSLGFTHHDEIPDWLRRQQTAPRQDRAVTADDYTPPAHTGPGVDIGRVEAEPLPDKPEK